MTSKCNSNYPRAGELRHEIKFERQGKTPDGGGGSAVAWNVVATMRVKIKSLSAGESFQAMRLESGKGFEMVGRYRDDLLESDRINFNGRIMQVRGLIDIDEMGDWLKILAEENRAT
jgi:SPP1 family predicted phage head-tail adaptor